MSYSLPTALFESAVAVDPTPGVVAQIDVRDTRLVAIYVKATDVVSVTIQRRAYRQLDFAEGQVFEEFTSIPANTPKTLDFDCGVNTELQLTAVTPGVGCVMDIAIKPDGGRR